MVCAVRALQCREAWRGLASGRCCTAKRAHRPAAQVDGGAAREFIVHAGHLQYRTCRAAVMASQAPHAMSACHGACTGSLLAGALGQLVARCRRGWHYRPARLSGTHCTEVHCAGSCPHAYAFGRGLVALPMMATGAAALRAYRGPSRHVCCAGWLPRISLCTASGSPAPHWWGTAPAQPWAA